MQSVIVITGHSISRAFRPVRELLRPRDRLIPSYPATRPELLAAYGTLQRDSATGALYRDKTKGGVRRNAWQQAAAMCCCASGRSVSGACPCGISGGFGNLPSSLKVTLSGWQVCGLGGCRPDAIFDNSTGLACDYRLDSYSVDGTYCVPYLGSATGTCSEAFTDYIATTPCTLCSYGMLLPTAASCTIWLNETSPHPLCTGASLTVTGIWLGISITMANIYNGSSSLTAPGENCPTIWVSTTFQAKADGSPWDGATDSQDELVYLGPDALDGSGSTNMCWNAQCGFTASKEDPVVDCSSWSSRVFPLSTIVSDGGC